MLVRHTCDNSLYVNPEHLLLGTQLDNMNDRVKRNHWTRSKLTVYEINEIKNYLTKNLYRGVILELAKKYNVNRSVISSIKNNRTWKYKTRKAKELNILTINENEIGGRL